jgi:hypothetical protein
MRSFTRAVIAPLRQLGLVPLQKMTPTVIFRLYSLHFDANNCHLSIAILHSSAVLDLQDVENENDGLLSGRLSSRFFLNGARRTAAEFLLFLHSLEVVMAGGGPV